MSSCVTEHDSCERGRHGEAELEVFGTERAEACYHKVETGQEQRQHPERWVRKDAPGQCLEVGSGPGVS